MENLYSSNRIPGKIVDGVSAVFFRKIFIAGLCSVCLATLSFGQNVNVNPGAVSYLTLKAAFDAINAGTHTGTVTVDVVGNTTETAPALLNASGVGSASYTTIVIQPSGGAARSISGAIVAGSPLIDLNGADNVTFDGLNSGGNSLAIANTTVSNTTATSTIRFIGGATNNTITRCAIQGSGTMAVGTNGGNIYFATDAVTANGNDNNTISSCDIGPAGANLPTKGIYGNGSATTTLLYNSGNIISGNNIFDYFGAAVASAGIYVSGGCTDWTITNNKLYQTATRTQTTGSIHAGIQIASANVNNCNISGNTIGFATNSGSGTYTFVGLGSSRFYPIYLSTHGTTTATSIQGNNISGIGLSGILSGTSTSAPFAGILINTGLANIGNITGNTIGSISASSSISFTSSATATSEIYGAYFFPSLSVIMSNNLVGGISATNSSTGAIIFYGLRAFTSTSFTNTIQNNVVGYTAAPISIIAGSSSSLTMGIFSQSGTSIVTGNTVRHLSMNGANTSTTATGMSMSGIVVSTTATPGNDISQNVIHSLSNTASAAVSVNGLVYSGSTTAGTHIVSRNLIHSISVSSATAIINGINIFVGNGVTYQNNMIRLGIDGSGSPITVGCGINGILEATSTTLSDNLYFNSVYIGGSGVTSSLNTFAFNSGVTTASRVYRNNIFYNARSNSSGTGKNYAVRVGGTTPNPAGLTINNNLYLANGTGGTFGLFNGSDVPNLGAWQAAVGQDVNSFSSDPQFSNPTGTSSTIDLHINPSNPTQVEGNGVNIPSITVDYDNQTRASFTPEDIGADAGNFTSAGDIIPPGIAYTILSTTCATGDRTLAGVTITDVTGVPTSGGLQPRIYYRKNADPWFSSQGTLASGTGLNGTWDFTIVEADMGGVSGSDVIQYYVIAQDLAGTPNIGSSPSAGLVATDVNNVTTAPTTPNSYTIGSTLSGTYSVGASGDYTTLTAAINAYNVSCLGGAVTFELIDNAYAETLPTINANVFASATNTLTIKPTISGTTISAAVTSAVLIINGGDYVIIDGSTGTDPNSVCPPSEASRDLTITNTSTGTTSAVIWLQTTAGNAATNNIVRNCNLVGNSNTTTLVGLGSGSSTIAINSLGTGNNNNSFINNTISKTQYGIYSQGASAANKNTGTIINQNQINTPSPNHVKRAGIFVGFENNILISDNNIGGMLSSVSNEDVFGITLGTNAITTTSFAGSEVTNAIVSKNVISSVRQTATYSASGLYVAPATSGTNLIANNMVSAVSANGTFNDFTSGIFIGGGAGSSTQVYYNTIKLSGTETGGSDKSYALALGGSNPTVDVRNNLLINTLNTGSGKNYAIAYGYNSFTNLTSNHNSYYVTTPGSLYFIGATGSLSSPVDRLTIADLQLATGKDTDAKNVNAVFLSASDLHIDDTNPINFPLNDAAITVSVTDDFDCDSRSTDIGSDEFVPDCNPPVFTLNPVDVTVCTNAITSFTTTVTGDLPITYQWQVYDLGMALWVNVVDNAVFSGATTANLTITNPSVSLNGTTYKLVASSFCNTDESTVAELTVNAAPVAVCPSAMTVCADAAPFLLNTATPTPGSYSGPGVASDIFDPAAAGLGTHLITYTADGGNGCFSTCTFNITVQGTVQNTNTGLYYCTIQGAINASATTNGHTIVAGAGAYNEDVLINKDITLQGAGAGLTTVSGPIGGGGATMQVTSPGVIIEGFTITRDGNNTTDWNNPNLNTAGISIQGQTVNAEIRNNEITGMRTAIDVNNSNNNNIHNNNIHFNRTGLIFRNQTDNTLVNENFIVNNWTVGVLFLDASGGTNSPVQSAINSSFNENDISANWYAQIVDRQSGGSLPLPGNNPKDFECNWYGAVPPVVTTANSTEPGYAAQIPTAYGGSAMPPGGQPDIAGPASANFDFINYLVNGADANVSEYGFQPVAASCSGAPVQNTTQNTGYSSIQDAVDNANPNDVIEVSPGVYNEEVTIDLSITLQGTTSNCADVIIEGNNILQFGVRILAGVQNVTLANFKVQNTVGANAGIWAATNNDGLEMQNLCLENTAGVGAILASGPVDGITINDCEVWGPGVNGRGIVIWDGFKENITITNNSVHDISGCCGIELQDGNASGVTMNANTVTNIGDSGMSAIGLNGSTGPNSVSGNMITNTGRFGIEIKNPNGNGTNISVTGNTVTISPSYSAVDPSELRDIAGIAVIRRALGPGNIDVPQGVTVTGNNIMGYMQDVAGSVSEGFGIVIEGSNHTVTGNTLNGNDVGIQQQAGHLPYPGDGDQSNLSDQFFGRGNSPQTCGNTISTNTFISNTTNTRNIGVGGGLITNLNTSETFCSIQSAINDAQTLNSHVISVSAGNYNEDVLVNKSLTIQGAGPGLSIVSGPIGGAGATFQVTATGVIIDGFTITRDGNNPTDWNNPGLNTVGVAVQGMSANAEIRNNLITGNRTGIDINNSNGNNIHNNIIDFNRTGLIFRNQTDNTSMTENYITNNWTVGLLFLDASSSSNVPQQSAANSFFNDNHFSGNWYAQIVDRQSGGALPPPGSNLKNFECNWFGTPIPTITTANSTEPGYAGQIPVAYGGAAVPPGGQPDIAGPASANFDYIPYLLDGTDDDGVEYAFQPVNGSCIGGVCFAFHNTSSNIYYCSLQQAINDVNTGDGDVIEVSPGTYTEIGQIVINKDLTIVGLGTGCGDVVFHPNANTGNSGDARGWWLVTPGTELNLEKVTLDGNGFLVYQAIRDRGFGDFDEVCFNDIKYNESGPDYAGTAVAAFGAAAGSNVNITNSTFTEIGRVGVLYFGTGVDGSTFDNNTYTGKGAGDWLDYALDISAGADVTVTDNTITNNYGVASSDNSGSAAILVSTFFGAGTSALINNNDLTGNSLAVSVGFNGSDASDVEAHQNDFSNNDDGVINTNPANVVDFTLNYWGDLDDSGPSGVGSGSGVSVSAGVLYCPWLSDVPGMGVAVSPSPVTITFTESSAGTNNDGIICPGAPVTLNATTSGATYLWSSGQTTATITVNPAANTTYFVTVTHPGGCTTVSSQLINVSSTCQSTMEWVLMPPGNSGSCAGGNDCCTTTLCYGLRYTPGATGTLTDYTTGFVASCLTVTPFNAVISNVSCVMLDDQSTVIPNCPGLGTFFNSSAQSGSVPVFEGIPIILHKVCFNIPVGQSVTVVEDIITDLTTSIDIGANDAISEFPTYGSFNIVRTQPVVPADGEGIAQCPPTSAPLPTVLDMCGDPIAGLLISTVDVPNPVTCNGTRVLTYRFTDCLGLFSDWSFTYTIERTSEPEIVEAADITASVVGIENATPPTLPIVQDVCGLELEPEFLGFVDEPTPIVCSGTRTYSYHYEDCAGIDLYWSFVYTVNNVPVMDCPDNLTVCSDDAPFSLAVVTPATPTGGTYSGAGVSMGTFTPLAAGNGTHTITYSYTNAQGCANSCMFTIRVNAAPVMVCPPSAAVCVNENAFVMPSAFPIGGMYSGTGVTGNMFNPAAAGIGPHVITYSYTAPNGCDGSCSWTYNVTNCPGDPDLEWEPEDPCDETSTCVPESNCCSNIMCFGLKYTPGTSGALIDYTTGFEIECVNNATPVVLNMSCVMPDNSVTYPNCNSFSMTLFNSSGNEGFVPITAGVPVILHKLCLYVPPGTTLNIEEDIITNLTMSVELTGGSTTVVEAPTYQTLVVTRTGPELPDNEGETVTCLDEIVGVPTPPVAYDQCCTQVTPTMSIINNPNPLACEGTRTYRFTYLDCGGASSVWDYVYTIEYDDFSVPPPDGSTVNCPAETNVAPTLVPVYDACGAEIIPSDPVISPLPVCEGSRTYTYTYEDCAGNEHDWVYTYNVVYLPFDITIANGSQTVSCPSEANTPPSELPTITDNCGVELLSSIPSASAPVVCEGTRTYVYTYTDCDGNSDTWSFVYMVDVPLPTVPDNVTVTVQCPDQTDMAPTPPVVANPCIGGFITPSSPAISMKPTCEGTRTYTYTYANCAGETSQWAYTYVVDRTTVPSQFGGPVQNAEVISCYLDATAPETLPEFRDACNNELMPSGPVVGGTNTGTCEGTITYTYTYTDCANLSTDWVYTYTVDCDAIRINVFLEGAFDSLNMVMTTHQNIHHLLPGMDKDLGPDPLIKALSPHTPFGHPYGVTPWSWAGNTGMLFGEYTHPSAPLSGLSPYPVDVVDWVLVTIRQNGILPANNIWTCAGWVHSDSHVSFPEPCTLPAFNTMNDYYFLVQHRNHLGVLSPEPAEFSCGTAVLEWDFTTSNSYVAIPGLHSGQKYNATGGSWVMLGGNSEQVAPGAIAINSADQSVWINQQNSFGYKAADFDLNVRVNNNDFTIWKRNQNRISGVIFY